MINAHQQHGPYVAYSEPPGFAWEQGHRRPICGSLDNAAISYDTNTLNPVSNHDIDRLHGIDERIPVMGWVQGFSKIKYNIMLNKVRKPKEQTRIGKLPENVQFKNKITKSINNSSYEMIRGIVETETTAVPQPQLEKQISKNINNLNPHKKNNINKKNLINNI